MTRYTTPWRTYEYTPEEADGIRKEWAGYLAELKRLEAERDGLDTAGKRANTKERKLIEAALKELTDLSGSMPPVPVTREAFYAHVLRMMNQTEDVLVNERAKFQRDVVERGVMDTFFSQTLKRLAVAEAKHYIAQRIMRIFEARPPENQNPGWLVDFVKGFNFYGDGVQAMYSNTNGSGIEDCLRQAVTEAVLGRYGSNPWTPILEVNEHFLEATWVAEPW